MDNMNSNVAFDSNDVAQNKVMGILAYIGFLFLVPLFAAKDSPYARFHTNQGLVLFIVEFAWGIVYGVISFVLGMVGLGFLAAILAIVNLVFLALMIIGIINACNGTATKLPVIGNITILK